MLINYSYIISYYTLVPSNSTLVLNSCVSLRLLLRAVESGAGTSGRLLVLACSLELSLPVNGDGDLSPDAKDTSGTLLLSVDAITGGLAG